MPSDHFPLQTGVITALSHEGRGIIKAAGKKTTFVDFAVLGEEVTYSVYKEHSKFDEAKVVSVLTASVVRVSPPCPYFGVCGGCSLQHMDHRAQIALKQRTVLEQLKHHANLVPQKILEPLLGDLWYYRHKAQLSVACRLKKAMVGFKQKNSHQVVDVKDCLVLSKRVAMSTITSLIKSLDGVDFVYDVDVAVGDDATAMIIKCKHPLTQEDTKRLQCAAKEQSVHCYVQPRGRESVYKLYPEDDACFLTYTVDGLSLRFHPSDFTQINPEVNRKMVVQAMDLLDLSPEDRVLDLYCGVGNFALPLAKRVAKVIGIEGVEEMVQRAKDNAALNGLSNVNFFRADLQKNKSTWPCQDYDKLLLDPPRTGANMPLVLSLDVPTIVYVSCDSAVLARDAKQLVQNGYGLQAVGIMDMFPHTKHVETMALFSKEQEGVFTFFFEKSSKNSPFLKGGLTSPY